MKTTRGVVTFVISLGLLFSSPVFANSVASLMADSVNSGIINTKMATDDFLSNTDVDATVENGVAVFSGKVYSRAQLYELVGIARSVSGIRGIDVSRLRIVHHY